MSAVFDHFLVARMSVRARKPKFIYQFSPGTQPVPDDIMDFLYPDGFSKLVKNTEHYAFVMTRQGGKKEYGFCNRRMQAGEGSRFPEVLCILSKKPYFAFFKVVLQAIQARWDASSGAALALLDAISKAEIKVNTNVCRVSVGSESFCFSVDHPIDYPYMREDYSCLMERMKPDAMILVLNAMLLEKRIIVLSESLPVLSNCMHALVSLLYPLTWEHIFIPLLPLIHIRCVSAPIPFLIGMHKRHLPQLFKMTVDEVVLVDVDACSIRLLGNKSEDLKKILPVELTGKLRKRLHWKDARRSPRFIQSCFTAFFAVLFAPCDWKWRTAKGAFDVKKLIRAADSDPNTQDLTNCFLAIQHSQMFETFTSHMVEREYKGSTGMVQTFDMLVETCKSNPSSFKLALKNILQIHDNRYKTNRFLPPLPKFDDLMSKLAHSTISNSKSMAQKALGKFNKFTSKLKKMHDKVRKKGSSSSGPDVRSSQRSPTRGGDDEPTNSDSGDHSGASSPKGIKSPGKSGLGVLNISRIEAKLAKMNQSGYPRGGEMLRKQFLASQPFPNLYETALEFTSNVPDGKRGDEEMITELVMGSAHSVGAKIIMDVLVDRLRDCKKASWRHGARALELLLYLIEFGGDIPIFHMAQNVDLLNELRSSYRHPDQTRQGFIRELARKVHRCASNVFALERARNFKVLIDANQIYKAPPRDPWYLKSAPGTANADSKIRRNQKALSPTEQGREKAMAIALKHQSTVNLRTQTIVDRKGMVIPPYELIHARFKPPRAVVAPAGGPTPMCAAERRALEHHNPSSVDLVPVMATSSQTPLKPGRAETGEVKKSRSRHKRNVTRDIDEEEDRGASTGTGSAKTGNVFGIGLFGDDGDDGGEPARNASMSKAVRSSTLPNPNTDSNIFASIFDSEPNEPRPKPSHASSDLRAQSRKLPAGAQAVFNPFLGLESLEANPFMGGVGTAGSGGGTFPRPNSGPSRSESTQPASAQKNSTATARTRVLSDAAIQPRAGPKEAKNSVNLAGQGSFFDMFEEKGVAGEGKGRRAEAASSGNSFEDGGLDPFAAAALGISAKAGSSQSKTKQTSAGARSRALSAQTSAKSSQEQQSFDPFAAAALGLGRNNGSSAARQRARPVGGRGGTRGNSTSRSPQPARQQVQPQQQADGDPFSILFAQAGGPIDRRESGSKKDKGDADDDDPFAGLF